MNLISYLNIYHQTSASFQAVLSFLTTISGYDFFIYLD